MGSFPPSRMRLSSSLPSSMMVRSAEKLVSNTLSKPSIRQGSDHLAGDDGAGLHAELVPQAHPDGGGHLDNDVLEGFWWRR